MFHDNDEQVQTQTQYEDKWLSCKDCGVDFLLEAGEIAFLHRLEEEGKTDADGNLMQYREPKRCRDCRNKRRATRR